MLITLPLLLVLHKLLHILISDEEACCQVHQLFGAYFRLKSVAEVAKTKGKKCAL